MVSPSPAMLVAYQKVSPEFVLTGERWHTVATAMNPSSQPNDFVLNRRVYRRASTNVVAQAVRAIDTPRSSALRSGFPGTPVAPGGGRGGAPDGSLISCYHCAENNSALNFQIVGDSKTFDVWMRLLP